MALRIQHIPKLFFSVSPITVFKHNKPKTRISCTGGDNEISDTALTTEFAEVASIVKARQLQAEEAMRKSRNILFKELCGYLRLNEDETKLKWNKMEEDERWVLVKGFVEEWDEFFHPLSARATKKMVEEYFQQENLPSKSSLPSSPLFPFDSIIGFP
ncbi:uncharacterized protein [Cicer arietinum]|uniref:Uncharacterized protein LOC101504291 n=1 Tax=Cicer arietinum TaxID=3827 RepID=A0A1S2XBE2_CICAR|nr:uncharacterized protein LOC101504291 [Cicer arietinum]